MFSLFSDYSSLWFDGIFNTVLLTFGGILFGGLLAVIFTVVKLYKLPVINQLINAYLFVIRGTPFLVQLFIIYYGPLQFEVFKSSIFSVLLESPLTCALIALSINTSAYTTALFYGAILNLPKGEVSSAEALGLKKITIILKIILPRMFYRVAPAYSNEILMVLKCSALVSSISVLDIMGTARQVMSFSYEVIPSLIIAGIIYVVISVLIHVLFKQVFKFKQII
ncbi:ABC transporter permease subunit [Thiotrichales bacterium 19S9-12]|nr:ABC transporter permease subunit [Thiotrichales bacterium 19S9-11]MCF6812144.1 ABC transporter permease subunit [Thiotrichales bacterium 19S9-12]